MGDVVEEPDGDAALHGGQQRGEHEAARVGLEADVVEGDIEGAGRPREKAGDATGDVSWPLPAIRERRELDLRGRRREVAQT